MVYDQKGKPLGRGENSGSAIDQAVSRKFRGIHPKDKRAAWDRLKVIGWSLHEHRRQSDAATESKNG